VNPRGADGSTAGGESIGMLLSPPILTTLSPRSIVGGTAQLKEDLKTTIASQTWTKEIVELAGPGLRW
jgi:hypothetical protein